MKVTAAITHKAGALRDAETRDSKGQRAGCELTPMQTTDHSVEAH